MACLFLLHYRSIGQVIQTSKGVCFNPTYSVFAGQTLCMIETQNGWTPTNTLPNGTTFASSVFSTSIVYDKKIRVPAGAKLVVDNQKTFVRCGFSMSPGSSIQILQGAGCNFYGCKFFSCDNMWYGIEVSEGATGFIMGGCKIEDALTAVLLSDGVKSKFYDNNFNRNWDGIQNKNAFTGVSGPSVTTFSNNTFETKGAFLNAPHAGFIGNSGLNLNHVVMSIGNTTGKNYFLNLNHGILSEFSDLKVTNCEFVGDVTDGIYAKDGSLTVTKSRFHDCRGGGICAESANLDVTYNSFSGNAEYGILDGVNLSAERISIQHNIFNFVKPDYFSGAIWMLCRSLAGVNNSAVPLNSISENQIFIDPNGGTLNNMWVVLVNSEEPSKDWMDISKNNITMTGTSGASTLGMFIDAVGIGNGYRILDNTIDCQSNATGGTQKGLFFWKGGATTGNMISHNKVAGSGTEQGSGFAIGVEKSEGVLVCDNLVDRFNTGFSFTGFNAGMTLRSNNIRAHKTLGLGISPDLDGISAEIGVQTLNTNFWSANQSDYPGLAAGLSGNIAANQFFVHDMTNPAETPPKRTLPATWFQPKIGNFNQCDDQVLPPNPKISFSEKEVAQKPASSTDLPAWQFFEYRRGLYLKLLENPSLITSDADATTFWSAWTNTNIEKFARVQNMIRNSANGIGNLQNQLETVRTNQATKSAELAVLEANIDVATVSDAFLDDKKVKLQALAVLNDQEISIRGLIRANVAAALDQAISVNNLISPANAWETNRKALNFLQLKRMKGQQLSDSEVSALETMANLPIEQAGSAKSDAVHWMPLCQFKKYQSASVVPHAEEVLRPKTVVESTMNVFPNPTSDKINVEFTKSASGKLQLVSITGTVMLEETIREASQRILDLTTYQSGIYFVRFEAENGIVTTKKIVIAR
jgi:hypothetical protein